MRQLLLCSEGSECGLGSATYSCSAFLEFYELPYMDPHSDCVIQYFIGKRNLEFIKRKIYPNWRRMPLHRAQSVISLPEGVSMRFEFLDAGQR